MPGPPALAPTNVWYAMSEMPEAIFPHHPKDATIVTQEQHQSPAPRLPAFKVTDHSDA